MPRAGRTKRSGSAGVAAAPKGERLQRVMAEAGVASRRGCEEMIEAGMVEVNGRVVTALPVFVDPAADRIVVQGRPLAKPERRLYLMLNKPARTLTTVSDEPEFRGNRTTVMDLVTHPAKARLFPVGRLDFETTGLLLLTNDGALADRLTHPRYGVTRTYQAVVGRPLDAAALDQIEREINREPRREGTDGGAGTAPVRLRVLKSGSQNTLVEVTLREGKNRQVRDVLERLGCRVKKLTRVGLGPLTLRAVASGQWRELERSELQALRRAGAPGSLQRQGAKP